MFKLCITPDKKKFSSFKTILMCSLFLAAIGCAPEHKAPVIDEWQQASVKHDIYVVQKGDTLYVIAWKYGMDFRDLAKANHLQAPYKIRTNQKLHLVRARAYVPPQHVATAAIKSPWIWPAVGTVVDEYGGSGDVGNKGIDIAGHAEGEPIVAANAGRVVYAGAGLSSYGNMLIVKHSASLLSAYGYNKRLLVKEGDNVRAGQKIALMGVNSSGQALLHFEIRYNGKPINPRKFLHASIVEH